MSILVDYAKDELNRIGMIDSGDPYNDLATKAILDLIELFASQGHSGFSAPYVVNAFRRLAMFKPLSPLTGEEDEWINIGDGLFQNKRYSAVFVGKDGTAYNNDGKAFTDDGGETWYTCRDSRVNVTFPYVVPDQPEYVYRNKEDWLPQYEGKWVAESEDKTDVLDKIRAEIEDIAFDWQEIDGEHESFMVVDLNDVLQIIDKYKAESER